MILCFKPLLCFPSHAEPNPNSLAALRGPSELSLLLSPFSSSPWCCWPFYSGNVTFQAICICSPLCLAGPHPSSVHGFLLSSSYSCSDLTFLDITYNGHALRLALCIPSQLQIFLLWHLSLPDNSDSMYLNTVCSCYENIIPERGGLHPFCSVLPSAVTGTQPKALSMPI